MVRQTAVPAGSESGRSASAHRARTRPGLLPVADRIRVTREGGRIFVTITRRGSRVFGLSDAEARYLAILLEAEARSAA